MPGRSDQPMGQSQSVIAEVRLRMEALEVSMAELHASCEERIDELDNRLGGTGARSRPRPPAQELGSEARGAAQQSSDLVHAAVVREMRERVDAQRELRDEAQFQQQALVRLASRMDEVAAEVRAELPRLGQEHLSQGASMVELGAAQAKMLARLDSLEQDLAQEASARAASEQAVERSLLALGEEARQRLDSETSQLRTQIAGLQDIAEACRSRGEAHETGVRSAHELVEQLAGEVASTRSAMGARTDAASAAGEEAMATMARLRDEVKQEVQASHKQITQQIMDLLRTITEAEDGTKDWVTSKISESEAGLRAWVEASGGSRSAVGKGGATMHHPSAMPGKGVVHHPPAMAAQAPPHLRPAFAPPVTPPVTSPCPHQQPYTLTPTPASSYCPVHCARC